MSLRNCLFFAAAMLLFTACRKERFSPEWHYQSSGTSYDLKDLFFWNDSMGYIVGGDQFSSGVVLFTDNGGSTWTLQNIADKSLSGVHGGSSQQTFIVGYDGYFFESRDTAQSWTFYRLPFWEALLSVSFTANNGGVAVGGLNYKEGEIYHFNADLQIDTIYRDIEHELSAVCHSDENTAHIVGYGYVARSTDGGRTWQQHETQGDFFRSVHFPSPTTGYAVGMAGTILKTTDGGSTWEKIRNGNSLFVPNKRFRDVYFKDENKGYIVGEGGLAWRTYNGGESWEVSDNLPDIDFLAVWGLSEGAVVVGKEGTILRWID